MATEQPALPDLEVQQVVHGDHNIVVGTGNVTINNLRSPESSLERRQLEVLLDRVEQFWIKGVLQGSVHEEALLELGKEVLPGVVEHPWEKVLEIPGQAGRPMHFECGIGEAFEEVGRFLLILGEPGGGKTTTLLELARELVARARSAVSQPIPVVFNLSTWATGKKPLSDWLAAELNAKYFVSRPLAKTWLAAGWLLPLLDGLDEVKSDSQGACIQAINAFVQGDGPPGLAVCSRSAEYLRLPVRLKLNGAVRLLPLTSEQIAEYLQKAGPELATLATALHADHGLQELGRSPLMLSVMALAYRGVPLVVVAERPQRAADVFSTYIDRMFERKGKGPQPYSKEATVTWLSRLARGLQACNQTVFLVEQLQPTWFGSSAQRWAYVVISRLMVGTAMGLAAALIALWKPLLLFQGALQGLGAGFLDGRRFDSWNSSGKVARWWWVLAHMAAAISIAVFLSWRQEFQSLILIWANALVWGLLFGLRARRGVSRDIETVETLRWSWRRAWKRGLWGFIPGLALTWLLWEVIARVVSRYPHSNVIRSDESTLFLVVGALLFVGTSYFLAALYGGLGYGILEAKSKVNQGIVLTARNGCLVGLGGAATLGTLMFLLTRSQFTYEAVLLALERSIPIGLFAGQIACFWFGGIDVLQHAALRLGLWRSGDAPLDHPRFLDHAAKLIFLRRVGGGYIFMHRLLLEHFASLEDHTEES